MQVMGKTPQARCTSPSKAQIPKLRYEYQNSFSDIMHLRLLIPKRGNVLSVKSKHTVKNLIRFHVQWNGAQATFFLLLKWDIREQDQQDAHFFSLICSN